MKTPRAHTIGRSMPRSQRLSKKYGPVVPLIVDPNGEVVDGHLRLQCLKDLGYQTVPTVTVRTNNPADIKAIRLAFNRIALETGWDKRKLRDELRYLIEVDFDLDLTGFDAPEIDAIIEIDTQSIGVVEDTDGVIMPQGPAVSRSGDTILCGHHRLTCGDGLDRTILANLLAGTSVRMVMTDPQYNLPIDNFIGGKGKIKHREFSAASGEMSDSQFTAFLEGYFDAAISVLSDGSLLYMWMDWRHIDALVTAGKKSELSLINICVWAKTASGMGSLYRSQHELCAIFKFGTAPHVNNVEFVKHGRSRSNVWTARGMAGWGGDRDELLRLHPTVKPVRLLADAILDASKRGDVILDSFIGGGSTLLACEDVGRRCFGVEIDPLYIDVAVRRWQAATGKDAVFADTGEIFNERSDRARKTAVMAAGADSLETIATPPSAPADDPDFGVDGRG